MKAEETLQERLQRELLAEAYRIWQAANYLAAVADGPFERWINRRLAKRYAILIDIATRRPTYDQLTGGW